MQSQFVKKLLRIQKIVISKENFENKVLTKRTR